MFAILGSTLFATFLTLFLAASTAFCFRFSLHELISGCCDNISMTVSLGTWEGGASPTNSIAKFASSELDKEFRSLFSDIFFSI